MLIPYSYTDFCNFNYNDPEDVLFEFVSTLLQIVDRRPAMPECMTMNDIDFINSTTVVKRSELRTRIEAIKDEIAAHNEMIHTLDATGNYPAIDKLLLPVDDRDAALDGTLLHCFIIGKYVITTSKYMLSIP